MAQKPIQVGAILDGVSPLKDGGMSVRFHTQEISKAEQVNLMGYYQQFGWMMFKPDEFAESDIPDEQSQDIEGRKKKRPSQRLRAAIYVLGQKRGVAPEEQDIFYEKRMEYFIDKIKELIDIEENKR